MAADISEGNAGRGISTFYVPAGYTDGESGGFLIAEIETNLRFCIDEKTRKIASFKSNYPEWWLVLPDLIGYGLDEFDQSSFRGQVSITHEWDKVILLDPQDHTRAFEI